MNYAIAVLSVAAALGANIALDRLAGVNPSVALFLCAIMLVALVGGTGPALFATALSILGFDYLFLEPVHSLVSEFKEIPRLVLFAVTALFVVWLSATQRRATAALRQARDEQQTTVGELRRLNEALSAENAERRRAEEKNRQAEHGLQLTIDSVPALVARHRVDGTIEFVNQTWCDYSGIAKERWKDRVRVSSAVHPDDGPVVEQGWIDALATGEPFETEQRLRGADGEYRWHLIRRVPRRDDRGDVVAWFGAGYDIEDRKRAEDALRRSEAELTKARHELQLIIDTVPVLMLRHRADGVIDFVNQVGRNYSGMVATNWKKRTSVTTHPDDVARLEEAWDVALATGEPFDIEVRLRRADGEYRWFASRRVPLRDSDGNVVAWYAAALDIEDRKRAEDALRRSETELTGARQELQQTIDTIPTLVGSYWPNGERDFVNQAWQRYTGLSQQQARRMNTTVVLRPDDETTSEGMWRACLATGEPYALEERLRRADGEFRWHWITRVPLRNESGDVVKWYAAGYDIEDRKRAEDALRGSEAQLAQARRELELTIDSIPVMVSTFEPDGMRSYVNQTWQDYTGSSQHEATGEGLNTSFYYHPDDAQRFDNAWRDSQAQGVMMSVDVRTRRADGAYRWYTMRRAPRRDENGNIVKWYSVGVDVEDQKIAEHALRQREIQLAKAERELRLTLDSIPTLAWRTRADGFAEYLNKRWLDYTGFSLEQSLGWGWQAVIHPDDRPRLHEAWLQMLATEAPVEVEARMRRFDGVYRWFLFREEGLRNEAGAVVGWYGTNTDIEDRKLAESALQRTGAYLAETQKISQTGSFAWDVATGRRFWSEQTYQIMQFDCDAEPSVERLIERIHPDDRALMQRHIEGAIAGADDQNYEARLLMPDGQIKYINVIAHRVKFESGNEEIVGALIDNTEVRKSQEALGAAQAALSHASRVLTLGEISATIAHEVNQPLAAIVANGQACLRFLRRESPDLNDVRGAIEWIVKDGNRAAQVIQRVRGFMKKADARKEPLDVNEIINEVTALLQRELAVHDVAPRLQLAPAIPLSIGDRVQLQQVIINLVMNGVEAMRGIANRAHALEIHSYEDEGQQVVVAVKDSGVGIPAETAGQLFDAFFSTKPSGLGIGLSICRSIIQDHGGRLWATQNEGAPGATFQFTLPSYRKPRGANRRAGKKDGKGPGAERDLEQIQLAITPDGRR